MAFLTTCQQLENNLRHDILSGKFSGKHRLPSETVLATRYSICRATVRKALNNLVRDGLVYRVKGCGTFATPAPERHIPRREAVRGHRRRKMVIFLSFSSSYSESMFRENLNSMKLFDEMSVVLESHSCDLMFVHIGMDFTPPRCLVDRDIDGILFHGRVPLDFRNRYMADVPCVAVSQFCPELNFSCVRSDPQMRAWLVLSHLKQLGHTRIGYVANEIEEYPQKERYHAFLNMLDFMKLPHRAEWDAVWQRSRVNGELCRENELSDYTPHLEPVMALSDAPTAFVCSDSWRAKCTHAALEKLGYSVPRDVSLVGARMLKTYFSPYQAPFYTALIDHSEQVCRQAVRVLMDQMFSPDPQPVLNVLIPPELDLSNSSASCRDNK